MAIKLTAESFLAGVRQSGLIESNLLDVRLREFEKAGVDSNDADALAAALVKSGSVTTWQSEKLLQGKFKGFLLGRYRLQQLLGRGEMSSIYLAEHVRMKRRCAIKVLPANKVKDTSYLGRFHREAEAVAALDHPNIVRAYDVDMEVEAGTEIHFLVMEYVEGRDVEKLREQGPFEVVQAVEYIRQAAEGLSHAHENGLVHRDIKPGNLLVDTKGVVKLLDLGLARFFNQTEEESLTIKHDEKVLGTADYLAPEQAVDSHAVDARADIYSLGCTLYFALVGQPPFTDGTLVQRLLAHQTKTPVAVTKLRPEVPESLAAILDKMMQKSKETRFQTAREVADALGRWLVKYAGDGWKEQHAEVFARLVGLAALRGEKIESVKAPVATSPINLPVPPGSDQRPAPMAAKGDKRKPRRPEVPQLPQPPRAESGPATPMPAPQPLKSPSGKSVAMPTEGPVTPAKRLSAASFRVPAKPPETWAEFLQYHQIWVILAIVMFGVFLIAGVSMSLQATTEENSSPPNDGAQVQPESGLD